jgi:phosphoserine phosphatase
VVARATVELSRIGTRELLERLERARGEGAAALAFDADGTLWSGDIGIDAFELAIKTDALREPAGEELRRRARAHGVPDARSPSEQAGLILQAFRAGRFPERDAFELMTACYAGYTPDELGEHARSAIIEFNLVSRLQRELEPILDWARASGVRSCVVSASPERVVSEAAELWGFTASDVTGVRCELADGRMLAKLEQFSYAEGKLQVARALFHGAEWLASFSDGGADVAMLLAARIGVAVRPGLRLRERMLSLPSLVLLDA